LPNEKGESLLKSARLFNLRLICPPVTSDGSPASLSDWIQSLLNLSTLDCRCQFSISDESIELSKRKTLKLASRIARNSFRLQDFHNFPQKKWEPKVKSSSDFPWSVLTGLIDSKAITPEFFSQFLDHFF
jgi:hypothetical protein